MDITTLIDALGGPAAVARICCISSQAVSQWSRVPVDRCRAIVAATNGAVTLTDLRPDIWPPEGEGQRDAA